jgi:DNA gyrase/topoisomerase IV subunit A
MTTTFGITEEMARVNQLQSELGDERVKLTNFKKKVVEVALKYAKENDWCSEVNDALSELGLSDLIPKLNKIVTLTYEVPIEGEIGWDDENYEEKAVDEIRYNGELIDSSVREDPYK